LLSNNPFVPSDGRAGGVVHFERPLGFVLEPDASRATARFLE
jgi:hypothetical protein